ncbi:MAG: hypothetical protein AUJ06_02915 [Chloroflexi bacterium 13_1_40CM_3_70_6]|nr:MAG: hypothetical protein AUJ06_02915 [Chloroflexi bacterium 13_1_40CM_3_70_6]
MVTGHATFAADIAIADEKIAALGAPGTLSAQAEEVYDAKGRYVLPGVIDGHVHFREPGLEYKEDFGSGSLAAVMGGVTSVVEMPNTKPPTDRPENVRLKQRLAEEKSYCDFGIIGVVVQENIDQIEPMAAAGVVGYKCFLGETIGNIPAPDDGMLLRSCSTSSGRRRPRAAPMPWPTWTRARRWPRWSRFSGWVCSRGTPARRSTSSTCPRRTGWT